MITIDEAHCKQFLMRVRFTENPHIRTARSHADFPVATVARTPRFASKSYFMEYRDDA